MLRLIRAYYRREYRNVPLQNLVMIVGAIIYILNPFDLIPDWIAGLGFADDAVVLAFAVRQTRQTLDGFITWEIASRERPALCSPHHTSHNAGSAIRWRSPVKYRPPKAR